MEQPKPTQSSFRPLDLTLPESVRGYLRSNESSSENEKQRFYRKQIEARLQDGQR